MSKLQHCQDGHMGDHAVHCSSEVAVKFQHNLVWDMLVDICCKVGIKVILGQRISYYLIGFMAKILVLI